MAGPSKRAKSLKSKKSEIHSSGHLLRETQCVISGAGELARRKRALAVPAEDPSSVPLHLHHGGARLLVSLVVPEDPTSRLCIKHSHT